MKKSQNNRNIPLEMIQQWLKDLDCDVRVAAMNACQGREIPLEVIQQGLKDSDRRVRVAAMNACQGREIPLEVIQQWLKDPDCDVRVAAMNACQGQEIPLEVIQQGLKDSDWDVRVAAMNACKKNGLPVPVIHTFEPPELVYKKCVGNVIVVASITKDAQIRGGVGRKCRASKAVIKEIIGDVCGEQVGISMYDMKTMYYPGDEVEIDDFDFGCAECSAGFHFFCSIEEARAY